MAAVAETRRERGKGGEGEGLARSCLCIFRSSSSALSICLNYTLLNRYHTCINQVTYHILAQLQLRAISVNRYNSSGSVAHTCTVCTVLYTSRWSIAVGAELI